MNQGVDEYVLVQLSNISFQFKKKKTEKKMQVILTPLHCMPIINKDYFLSNYLLQQIMFYLGKHSQIL